MSLHCLLLFEHPTRTGGKKSPEGLWETLGFTGSAGEQNFQQECKLVKSPLKFPCRFQGDWIHISSSSPLWQEKYHPSGQVQLFFRVMLLFSI